MLSKHAESIEAVDGSKHAAAVVIKNKVVGIGTNSYKSHPFANKYAYRDGAIYPHAETSAIMDALRKVDDLSKATLYVVRVRKDGELAMSKPCEGCARCIADYNIKKIIYTNETGSAELQTN